MNGEVKISGEGNLSYVTFEEGTNDARFAYLMCKKATISRKIKVNNGYITKKDSLAFGHPDY